MRHRSASKATSSPTLQNKRMAPRAINNHLARLHAPRKALRASAPKAWISRRYRKAICSIYAKGAPSNDLPQNAKKPAREPPLRAFSAHAVRGPGAMPPPCARIEKRPPRARRPALPQPCAAVLSAKAGLTAGFGMGPGDPRLCGRARGGRSPAALSIRACQEPLAGATLAAAWRARKKTTHRARCLSSRMRRARAISAARLSASPRLHLRPIDQVVYLGPYRRVDSSRRRLPA